MEILGSFVAYFHTTGDASEVYDFASDLNAI